MIDLRGVFPALATPFVRGWVATDRLHLRLTNDRHIVTMHYGTDGRTWERHPWRYEVSGYHQNVLGGFLSLRPSLYASGDGDVRYRDFRYRAL